MYVGKRLKTFINPNNRHKNQDVDNKIYENIKIKICSYHFRKIPISWTAKNENRCGNTIGLVINEMKQTRS